MDKFLTSYIDIAQEDAAGNPATGFSRVKARTNGSLTSRTPAGVDSTLGGSISSFSSVLAANITQAAVNTKTAITGFAVSVPPQKTAMVSVVYLSENLNTVAAAAYNFFVDISNPAGSNSAITYSYSSKMGVSNVATATQVVSGNAASVAAGATSPIQTVASIGTNLTPVGNLFLLLLTNPSTNATTTVTFSYSSANAASKFLARSSIFALIT